MVGRLGRSHRVAPLTVGTSARCARHTVDKMVHAKGKACLAAGAYNLNIPPPPLEPVVLRNLERSWAQSLHISLHALMLSYKGVDS